MFYIFTYVLSIFRCVCVCIYIMYMHVLYICMWVGGWVCIGPTYIFIYIYIYM